MKTNFMTKNTKTVAAVCDRCFSIHFLFAILGVALLLTTGPAVHAADFAVQKTFWSASNSTNVPTTVTNLRAAIDVTMVTDFSLQVKTVATNASTGGTLDVVWDTSNSGDWGTGFGNPLPGSRGWFSLPLTNNGNVTSVFTTNITVNGVGYWRIVAITNSVAQCITNWSVLGYVKPKRQNRDY
jgi:hypothetical protein